MQPDRSKEQFLPIALSNLILSTHYYFGSVMVFCIPLLLKMRSQKDQPPLVERRTQL
ncbi:hypothetical protein [Prochlorococcus marinus]|uniref:hypothetical protein n=1 Tax=Prochlorococcus marinus TaxID=1219 RepID=UPI0022B3F3D0|nr:hypothetical protein [Prochlorococcus marinus]